MLRRGLLRVLDRLLIRLNGAPLFAHLTDALLGAQRVALHRDQLARVRLAA